MKTGVKLFEVLRVEEINETVAYVALVFDVAGQVEEVIGVG